LAAFEVITEVVVNKLNRSSLPRLDHAQRLFDETDSLRSLKWIGSLCSLYDLWQEILDAFGIIEVAGSQLTPPIDSPAVREHQEPGLKSTLLRIESSHRAYEFKKDLLRNFFRFRVITEHAACIAEYKRTVTLKQDGKRFHIAGLELRSQILITTQLEP
jgi:hypothetical protein